KRGGAVARERCQPGPSRTAPGAGLVEDDESIGCPFRRDRGALVQERRHSAAPPDAFRPLWAATRGARGQRKSEDAREQAGQTPRRKRSAKPREPEHALAAPQLRRHSVPRRNV